MRPLLIANIERIEDTEFLVAQLFGEDGYLLDTVIKRYESPEVSVDYVKEIGLTYGIDTLELWTSNRELYLAALNVIGIGASIKHPSDTSCTRVASEDMRAHLTQLNIPVKLSRWRLRIIDVLKSIIQKLEGEI